MTYKNLKKFLLSNQNNTIINFDLMPRGIKSKIIFCVGDGASNTASALSSILSERGIAHSHYVNCFSQELKNRFLKDKMPVQIDLICQNAEKIIRKSGKNISNDALLFALALRVLDDEYVIIEMSDTFYDTVSGRLSFTPLSVLFTTTNDENNRSLIEKAPRGVEEIFAISQAPDYDYVSNHKNKFGTRVSYVSQNKITVAKQGIIGTDVYYYSYLYRLPTIDQRNNLLMILAHDCARVLFGISKATIYKGLAKARLINDFEVYSVCPNVLLYIGNEEFVLPQGMRYKIIREGEDIRPPTENTVFCGSADFLSEVKRKLKK